ncbi:uncharacterized protein LOC106780150 [Vigna radiata var. radiata]|uniref:Uncharacterized protein LOC106780150 n=1 Tax=Vigna radiata var. radiata TaxID=3916 RepID=A0A1S3VZV9_VIGRR|nr:uncharacterized protein LOC106780150 [Vigna radiata var. radiata]
MGDTNCESDENVEEQTDISSTIEIARPFSPSPTLPTFTGEENPKNMSAITLRSGKQTVVPSEPTPTPTPKPATCHKNEDQSGPRRTFEIPKYVKFLKDLCTNKRKMKGNERISMGRNVSVLIGKPVPHIPEKCKDPGAFINVMPLSIYKYLSLGPLKPTGVFVQLASRSVTHTTGYIEDVLVRVGELSFSADFYVLEMEEGFSPGSAPIILGRPFLKTARTKIDVYAGTLSMEFANIVVHFNILDAMKFPAKDHFVFRIDMLDDIIDKNVVGFENDVDIVVDFDEDCDVQDIDAMRDIDDVVDISVMDMDLDCDEMGVLPLPVNSLESEYINHVVGSTNESYLQAPTLELKPLPDNLKYVYLEDDEKKPVIISTSLDSVQ